MILTFFIPIFQTRVNTWLPFISMYDLNLLPVKWIDETKWWKFQIIISFSSSRFSLKLNFHSLWQILITHFYSWKIGFYFIQAFSLILHLRLLFFRVVFFFKIFSQKSTIQFFKMVSKIKNAFTIFLTKKWKGVGYFKTKLMILKRWFFFVFCFLFDITSKFYSGIF
jgi:hypothetical protein